jgi:hypothetical protein
VAGVVTNICHSSHPSQATCPAGCRVASPQATVSHLPVPLIVPLPHVPLVRLIFASPHFSCRRLPSAGTSVSHSVVASRHAPLRPLVRLVKASPLLTPPQPICRIIGSSQRSRLMLVVHVFLFCIVLQSARRTENNWRGGSVFDSTVLYPEQFAHVLNSSHMFRLTFW